ncbi:type II toxin-antitoxin system toxin ribonuclease C26 [Arthrobacter tumbae]|uniref:PIN domain-containing protein n=1 Tax=Arthrobacter tumbae TaxID=163874 RepID=UPI001959B269|nr:PIN domain-containing protein [Arthrobacter tumbae]MBM7780339.1 putative nucleic acid-binding protein [Arthrobacter tumbae]
MANLVVDTSALLAYFDASEPDHAAVSDAIGAVGTQLLVVSPYVVAELDYLVATRHGVEAELAVVDELMSGAWELAGFGASDLRKAHAVITQYRDQAIGVADASNVVLAERYGTQTVLTLDRRHFEVLRPLTGTRFTVLP